MSIIPGETYKRKVIRRNCNLVAAVGSKAETSAVSPTSIPYSGFPPPVVSTSAGLDGWPCGSGTVSGPTAVATVLVCLTNSFLVNFPRNYDRGSLCLDKDNLICEARSALW